jgi:DNA ligase-associated metallophosphoesterase
MKSNAHQIVWAGESLDLLPERAVWWPRKQTLFVADLHFGKASAFRSAGIAVPETSHDDDLDRLEKIVLQHAAKTLVILGDFFHAKIGRTEPTLMALKRWRDRHEDLEIILVTGNHDVHAGPPPDEWNIRCVQEPWMLGPFTCRHKPVERNSTGFALAGHIHPAFLLQERGGVSARCLCFYFQKHTAVLPAFGNFTGAHVIRPKSGEQVFLVADDQIIDASRLIVADS